MNKSFLIIAIFILFLAGSIFFIKESDKKKLEDNFELPEEILSENIATPPIAETEQPKPKEDTSFKSVSPAVTAKEFLIPSLVKTEIDFPLKLSVPEIPVATTSAKATSSEPKLPPLDEEALLGAIVKIQCPSSDGLGKYVGSGFALKGGIIVTAAHVIKDSSSDICDIIFPRDRRPAYYLKGTIDNLKEVIRRHDASGIDFAVLKLPDINSYPDAKAIFSEYPYISYPVCENPAMLGDKLLHFGYPSNYVDQGYLSKLSGESIVYMDIKGVKDALSEDQTFTYRTPIFFSTSNELKMHPYMISKVASFYGDSGGLAFNEVKQCILGPHRGGTIGKSSGENYSVFMLMGWDNVKGLY